MPEGACRVRRRRGGEPADAKSLHRCAGPVRRGSHGGPHLL